jgi:alpha-L-arabinofuranosidase
MMTLQARPLRSLVTGISLLFAASPATLGQARITILADQGKDTINRNIYGHFSEHLGRCIYGGFYVGEGNTTIPNTRGIRNDIVQALKKIKIPVLRWPGGCFADTYHWKDGIGPKDRRPQIVNVWWGGVTENNSFGTHEFLDLCEQIGAEPYIAGNVGSGTVQELTQWVQYTNFGGTSPMSTLRAANGREKPWNVRFWGIGNEAWGCGGNMTAEYYANVYKTNATFIAGGWSNTRLFRVACGAGGDDFHWTEVMMRDIPRGLLEGVALHYYSVIDWGKKGSATDFSEQQYFTSMQRALHMEELIKKHTAIMDKYDPKNQVALVVDEWGGWYDTEPGTNSAFLYQQNTMRDAMIAGVTLNMFNNRCDRVKMANLAQTVNVLQAVALTNEEKMILTPTYHVMEMYTVHHDAMMIPLRVESDNYVMGKDTLRAVSASASRGKDGATHLSLVNIDAGKEQNVRIDVQGGLFTSVSGRLLAAQKVQDHNTFENPDHVKPVEFRGAHMEGKSLRVQMPPCSVVVLTLK